MKSRIVGLLAAALLISIPTAARANTIAITGGAFATGSGHPDAAVTSGEFALNFIVPRISIDLPSFHPAAGYSGGYGDHVHGLLTTAGVSSGFSLPSATNGSYEGAADALLRTGLFTISIPGGPSFSFAIQSPFGWSGGGGDAGQGDGGANGNGHWPSAGLPGFVGDLPGGGSVWFSDSGRVLLNGKHGDGSYLGDPALTSNPEPATLLLMGTAMLLAARVYRRRRPSQSC